MQQGAIELEDVKASYTAIQDCPEADCTGSLRFCELEWHRRGLNRTD